MAPSTIWTPRPSLKSDAGGAAVIERMPRSVAVLAPPGTSSMDSRGAGDLVDDVDAVPASLT